MDGYGEVQERGGGGDFDLDQRFSQERQSTNQRLEEAVSVLSTQADEVLNRVAALERSPGGAGMDADVRRALQSLEDGVQGAREAADAAFQQARALGRTVEETDRSNKERFSKFEARLYLVEGTEGRDRQAFVRSPPPNNDVEDPRKSVLTGSPDSLSQSGAGRSLFPRSRDDTTGTPTTRSPLPQVSRVNVQEMAAGARGSVTSADLRVPIATREPVRVAPATTGSLSTGPVSRLSRGSNGTNSAEVPPQEVSFRPALRNAGNAPFAFTS
mmetsp:Transcript_21854/g.46894  ORF Transcript_21854/g.46894 Transcript_21854/m.46894 type:complete len:271 (-) Transcript_21854:123-935(-)